MSQLGVANKPWQSKEQVVSPDLDPNHRNLFKKTCLRHHKGLSKSIPITATFFVACLEAHVAFGQAIGIVASSDQSYTTF